MIYPIHHLPDKVPVGVQTEQDVEDIGFDLRPWLAVFPDLVFTVWATRPGEQDAYPVNEQMLIGSVLYWHPDGYDTAIAGEGRVEIVGVGENRRKLSGFVPTTIHATSMGTTKEPGENTVPWYEKIINAAMEIAADVDVGAGGLYLVTATHKDSPYISYADRGQAEIRDAVAAGKTCLLVSDGRVYTYFGDTYHSEGDCPTFIAAPEYKRDQGIIYWQAQVLLDGRVSTNGYTPAKTPNPYKLTIGGQTYDGSKDVSVDIPAIQEDKQFVVTVTPTSSGWASDHSRAEIDAAQAAGKACLMHFPVSGEVMVYRGNYKFASNVYSNNASAPGLYFDWAEVNADQTVDKYGGGPLTAYPGAVSSSKGTCYLRWNGTKWEEATIAQLKADLGLT
jgi:hypothetical protein